MCSACRTCPVLSSTGARRWRVPSSAGTLRYAWWFTTRDHPRDQRPSPAVVRSDIPGYLTLARPDYTSGYQCQDFIGIKGWVPVELEHWDTGRDGELTEAGLRQRLEQRGYRVSRYVYPPGTYFPEHKHGVDKIDAVLSGRFRMTMGGRSVVLEAGDCLTVPRGAVHSAEVVGDQPVVSLDAVRI